MKLFFSSLFLGGALLLAWAGAAAPPEADSPYDPTAYARNHPDTGNFEATVPPQCYTKTDGVSNPCWTCHTVPAVGNPNYLNDVDLQKEYSFSDFALVNRWDNLFEDFTAEVEAIGDEEILDYVRTDNYRQLREALVGNGEIPLWKPDLDFDQGFDDEGFARDGSAWRAIRFKPFLGTFWPTNGSTDDVFIRLPEEFRSTGGREDREIYRVNLAIVEAAIAADPFVRDTNLLRRVTEPLDEAKAGVDLDGDGEVGGTAEEIRGLPKRFVGDAKNVRVRRYLHPKGTEYLHTVRYIDPDEPLLLSRRMKEVRYSRKARFLEGWDLVYAYEVEAEDKDRGLLPVFAGSPYVGLLNDFGWQLQGYIEDAEGRLRLQSREEHLAFMGCHSALGVTVDQTFTLARKVPGAEGWRQQDLRGMADVPQVGHAEGEILTYLKRVRGGDEFRANAEMLERFFPGGELDEAEVLRTAPGGEKDITHLIVPSRQRALMLNKTYLALVRRQSFEFGRFIAGGSIENMHREIENGSTELGETGQVWSDGRLWLDWGEATSFDPPEESESTSSVSRSASRKPEK